MALEGDNFKIIQEEDKLYELRDKLKINHISFVLSLLWEFKNISTKWMLCDVDDWMMYDWNSGIFWSTDEEKMEWLSNFSVLANLQFGSKDLEKRLDGFFFV